ncbi:DUF1178 family protein [Polymorphobacter sp.]|uniref:DUF1178 family protein n=1 Tax=Polymorphobacter sp. TaxID=1909290 RepID=UPI003F6F80CE
MIVFDLKCSADHVFEAWFGSTGDYDNQRTRGLVSCPLCGDASIEKAAMAPAVPAKGNRQPSDAARLLAAQRLVESRSDWVGPRFAAEARALHETGEARTIHGEASAAEVRSLLEDGVPVLPLPFAPLAKSDA